MKNIDLILEIEKEADIELYSSLFKRAIQNLVDNAIKELSITGGTIKVKVDTKDDRLIIQISDTGSGIPADIRDQLFNPFVFRRSEGTGLGLYIVHRVITVIHKGSLTFNTEDKVGTTFVIELPIIKKVELA